MTKPETIECPECNGAGCFWCGGTGLMEVQVDTDTEYNVESIGDDEDEDEEDNLKRI